jgi:hypothetical protein
MLTATSDPIAAGRNENSSQPASRIPYLHLRGGTFYFKRKIPAAIQWAFGGAKQVWRSLQTSNPTEAIQALEASLQDFDVEAANARHMKGEAVMRKEQVRLRITGTTKYLLEAHIGPLLSRFEHAHLSTDDLERRGLTTKERRARRKILKEALRQMLKQAATANFDDYEEVAQLLLSEERLIAPPGSGIRRSFTERLLQKDIEVAETQLERLDGRVTPTPRQVPPPPRQLATMLDVFHSWKKTQKSIRTVDAYRGFVTEFEHVASALPCVSVNLGTVEALCDNLLGRGCARETIENYVGGLATMFRCGLRCGLIPEETVNAFALFDLEHIPLRSAGEDRRGYEMSELNIFFQSRLYTGGYRPEGQANEASHWAPLVAVFAGARLEEIAQQRVDDILRINGVWAFRFANLDEDQRLKTETSWRFVPVHPILIRCGFLAYVAATKLAGEQRLYPSLRNGNKYKLWSNALGKWFSGYLDGIGLEDDRLCFHSFRFTFRQWCTHCEVSDEARDALTGHWVSKSTPGRAYLKVAERQYPFPVLAREMQKLNYGELDLSHLYVANPMQDVEKALAPASASPTLPTPVKRKRAASVRR